MLTSGGDAPGMNAAIRAVVRTTIGAGADAWGIERGFEGLLERSFRPLSLGSVGGVLDRGGTFLGTSRSARFMTEEGLAEACRILKETEIDGLVVIGGNGSFRGAHELHECGVKVVGVPGTIDNDVAGTDTCIGFDTTLNTICDATSKVRDTASQPRAHVRHRGHGARVRDARALRGARLRRRLHPRARGAVEASRTCAAASSGASRAARSTRSSSSPRVPATRSVWPRTSRVRARTTCARSSSGTSSAAARRRRSTASSASRMGSAAVRALLAGESGDDDGAEERGRGHDPARPRGSAASTRCGRSSTTSRWCSRCSDLRARRSPSRTRAPRPRGGSPRRCRRAAGGA